MVGSLRRDVSSKRLGEDIIPFLFGVAANHTLKSLDISGHKMGNQGAFVLARVIHVNRTLESLVYDENGIDVHGLERILLALKTNSCLRNIAIPLLDIKAAMEADSSNTVELLKIVGQLQYYGPTGNIQDPVKSCLRFPRTIVRKKHKKVKKSTVSPVSKDDSSIKTRSSLSFSLASDSLVPSHPHTERHPLTEAVKVQNKYPSHISPRTDIRRKPKDATKLSKEVRKSVQKTAQNKQDK